MTNLPPTIPKQPFLKPAEDYYRLRREGIGFIEQMGSRLWTDYNTHDPGITILEALCFALTDLAYRTGWDIKDILAPAKLSTDPNQPFPNQPFFTAGKILTVSPWTPEDFRRLLIDLDLVRNAWIFCKECACDQYYYARCEEGELLLSFRKPSDPTLQWKKVEPLGMYEVLVELESDPVLGDLNDRKIERRFIDVIDSDGKPHPMTMELRFPDWGLEKWQEWNLFLEPEASFTFKLSGFGAVKTYNLLTEPDEAKRDQYVRDHWNRIFYVSFELTMNNGQTLTIEHTALRLFGDSSAKSKTTLSGLIAKLENATTSGLLLPYHNKLLKVEDALTKAKKTLRHHRNLDEDYCRIGVVNVEDVTVCADVEVAPDADIERVQARIWFELEQYFNPSVPFYTLQELMDAGIPVEHIFNGPELNNGFIKSEDLAAAGLKTVLRTSDIINNLMDIEGVMAINNLLLSKYDSEGKIIKGAADPAWINGQPLFDANKTSAAWLLFVTPGHQPRLYHNQSRFLFYINGLPFLPRLDETRDTLIQLRGEAERSKNKNADKDLPIPTGAFRNPEEYSPVQNGFPLTYGIGPEGLPSHISSERRAQARQLKAYLMVFEQILGNALAQLANTAELFSLDPAIRRTYFVREFSQDLIQGYADIINGLDESALTAMTETLPEFYDRRNRFLDHILARFGEQFTEYALLMTDLQGRQAAGEQLIKDKISFLQAYPEISHDRGRAFNDKYDPCAPDNISGLKKRISLLLGYPDLTFVSDSVLDSGGGDYEMTFHLQDRNNKVWLTGDITITASGPDKIESKAWRELLRQMIKSDAYEMAGEDSGFRLKLIDNNGDLLGRHPELFQQQSEAEAFRDELLTWSSNERAIVVEHLLLRPKFPGDALYPACSDGACKTCGDEDPYSFRLTLVMPGWTAPFNTNLNMRDFAERTIRQETPSHLLAKICWVDSQFERFETAWCNWLEANAGFDWTAERLQERVEAILKSNLRTAPETITSTQDELCRCAADILTKYGMDFYHWLEVKFKEGNTPDDPPDFTPDKVTLCSGFIFNDGTADQIEKLLIKRYEAYKEVSYRLWVLVNLLSRLRSTYPVATLHDCDAGSDQNPVLLGKTALGS